MQSPLHVLAAPNACCIQLICVPACCHGFEQVFGADSAQEKLFKQSVIPIVQEVLEGFNCTIFAYGQTGTGTRSCNQIPVSL